MGQDAVDGDEGEERGEDVKALLLRGWGCQSERDADDPAYGVHEEARDGVGEVEVPWTGAPFG